MYENLKRSFYPLSAIRGFGNKIFYGLALTKSIFLVAINRIIFIKKMPYLQYLGKNIKDEIFLVK